MQRIELPDLSGRTVVLEQDLKCSKTFQVGDIVKDLTCVSYPFQNYYTIVGFTRSFKGNIEFLWYTKPSLWIPYREIRVWYIVDSFDKSSLPWLNIIKRNPGSNSTKREIFNSLLKILKIQYSLY